MNSVENDGDGYSIMSEQVHALVPSNQLLRPWDNVPRQAKAQEITKNRLIYGNYLQNYNITEEPSFIIHGKQHEVANLTPTESLKSIRNYQIGVVFLDEYGRQTPVLSNSSGALRLDQRYAETANTFQTQVVKNNNGDALAKPDWATHYRYFIKEPSLEYYNLAMDRFYTQDGDHVWLSFASAERNKIDEETYLILKKQHDSDFPALSAENETGTNSVRSLKYKVLDVKDEAPKSIRKSKRLIKSISTQFGITEVGTGQIGFPKKDALFVNIPYATIKDTAVEPLIEENPNEVYIRIAYVNGKSEYYQLTTIEAINTPPIGSTSTNITGHWKFSLKIPLASDVDFTEDGAGTERGGLSAEFYKEDIEDLEEFEGRFFVKIRRDNDLDQNLLSFQQTPIYGVEASAGFVHINYIKSGYPENDPEYKTTGNLGHAPATRERFSKKDAQWCIDQAVFYTQKNDGLDGQGLSLIHI